MGCSCHPDSRSIQSQGGLSSSSNVRFAPESDQMLRCREMTQWANSDQKCGAQKRALIDHLIGDGEQRLRYCKTQRFHGLCIDRQLELARSQRVGRLFRTASALLLANFRFLERPNAVR
jgi:hypothetical protein